MKKCIKCGKELDDDAIFCSGCGTKVEPECSFCPKCGTKLEAGTAFCPKCGTKIENNTTIQETPVSENPFNFDSDFNPFQPSKNTNDFDSLANSLEKGANEDALKIYKYEKTVSGKYVIKGLKDEYASDIVIPGCVEVIDDNAFRENESLMIVKICEGVKKIGKGAFRECINLSSVEIPSSVTIIEDEAFLNCENLSLTIPQTVKVRGRWVLEGTLTGDDQEKNRVETDDEKYWLEDIMSDEENYLQTRIALECKKNEKHNKVDIGLLEKGVKYQDAYCTFMLGCYYLNGIHVEKNEKKGLQLVRKFPNPIAQTTYAAYLLKNGEKHKAYKLLEPAAFLTNYRYAYWVLYQDSVYNKQANESYLEKIASAPIIGHKNFPNGLNEDGFYCYLAGLEYYNGQNVPQDYQKAFNAFDFGATNYNDASCLAMRGVLRCVSANSNQNPNKIFEDGIKDMEMSFSGREDVFGIVASGALFLAQQITFNPLAANFPKYRTKSNVKSLLDKAVALMGDKQDPNITNGVQLTLNSAEFKNLN